MTPVAQVPFNYCETLTARGIMAVSSMNQAAAKQLVTVVAKAAHVSGVKKISTLRQGVLRKQEETIHDTKASIKLVLWES